MPKSLQKPVIQIFKLFPDDPTDDTRVAVRLATQGDVETRQRYLEAGPRTYKQDQSVLFDSDWTIADTRRLEVFLTLADCNIMIESDDGGGADTLFHFKDNRFAGSFEEFGKCWQLLPSTWATRIHDCVLEHNEVFIPKLVGT